MRPDPDAEGRPVLGEADDRDLMARIARGDAGAFRQLSRRHATPALGLARRITGNQALAEEVVQEALLRVWVNAPRWRPVAFKPWLYRIVTNLCLNLERRTPFAPLEAAGDPPDQGPDAATALERVELDQRVAAAVAALPARQRTAIVLTYQEGLDNAEAAAILETSVSGLEALLVRARRSLRAALAEETE